MFIGYEVLMEADDNISMSVGDLQVILEQQLTPHPMHLLNSIVILFNYIII